MDDSLEGLARLSHRLAVLQLRQLPLQLKGEVLVENGHGFFLGSPAVHSLDDLRRLGIGMADLPRHDGLLDSVLQLQINDLQLQDEVSRRTRELTELATHDELTGVAAQRLVQGFATSPRVLPEQHLVSLINVTVGIACTEPAGAEPITHTLLIGRADQALYRSKHAGRSRYTSSGLSPC